MPTYDVNFPYVREHADILAVLTHYGIEAKGEKEQKVALCPFHKDTKPSLKVNTDKKLFNCFSCGTGGNVVDFVAIKEGVDIRKAAIKVAEICGIATRHGGKPFVNGSKSASEPKNKASEGEKPASADTSDQAEIPTFEADELDGVAYNKPLTFALKLDTEPHPWLVSRGIAPGKIEEFGVGLANRGSMKGRLAIPIHNEIGELVAYCGRYPADEIPDGEAKYKQPDGFRKDLEIFGLYRVPKKQKMVFIVESFLSVIQHARPDMAVISMMGLSISEEQVAKLVAWDVKSAAILFDGDAPGREGAKDVAGALAAAGIWTKIGNTPDNKKPHQMSYEEMISCFNR